MTFVTFAKLARLLAKPLTTVDRFASSRYAAPAPRRCGTFGKERP